MRTRLHDNPPPYGAESVHQDVASDWCVGHTWSRCVDPWSGHGHALGAMGEAIQYDVPSRIVHAGNLRCYGCLLFDYGCVPHPVENGDQQP